MIAAIVIAADLSSSLPFDLSASAPSTVHRRHSSQTQTN
jgi:hypothetical protein